MFKHDLGMRYAPAFLASIEENRSYWGPWLPWATTITTLEGAQNFIKRGVNRYAEDGLPWVGIWLNNALVGGILWFPLDAYTRSTEIGYWLAERAKGKGIMTRAAKAMLGFVFDEIKVNKVALHAQPENAPSCAVAERLGFHRDGINRHGWVNQGQFVDLVIYSMLASEWAAQKTAAQ
jgi:ribosomal-protein-serine acetyltransferase